MLVRCRCAKQLIPPNKILNPYNITICLADRHFAKHEMKNMPEQHNQSQRSYYTCLMHAEIHDEQPGNCPKCGMKLIKK